jgi:hypothetical protein
MRKLRLSFSLWTSANTNAKGIRAIFSTAKIMIRRPEIGMKVASVAALFKLLSLLGFFVNTKIGVIKNIMILNGGTAVIKAPYFLSYLSELIASTTPS